MILLLTQVNEMLGQCVADAGPDKVVCCDYAYGVDTNFIGGSPTAFGGTPPYTYIWEAHHVYTLGGYTEILPASWFLNDTTIANPSVINFEDNPPVEFYLTVIDANNTVSKDTVKVDFSIYGYFWGYSGYQIMQGDSVYLWGIQTVLGGIPPFEYLWRPNHGLTDSTTLSGFWAKPDYSTSYYITVTDSAGCVAVGTTSYEVIVIPVSVEEYLSENFKIVLTPNPVDDILTINIEPNNFNFLLLNIYDLSGHIIVNKIIENQTNKIDLNELETGIYLYEMINKRQIVSKGKLVKK